jgi:hypothetical protein
MRVILIPCSGRKRHGGSSSEVIHVKNCLSADAQRALIESRIDLAELKGFEPGPDLGNETSSTIELLPAWQRYEGNLYRKASLTKADVSRTDVSIFIISALFGVVSAQAGIRPYNLAMTDALPDGNKVMKFWRIRGLGSIVADLLRGVGAVEVHDFLSGSYRDVVDLSNQLPVGCEYFPHSYPGLGSGSDYHRGMDLRRVLDE